MSSLNLGLINCPGNWSSTFCITKTVQTCFSIILIILILVQMIHYYHSLGFIKSSFIVIINLLMLLTLTFNIAFSIYHTVYALLYLETYFNSMYFVILCYYLIYNVFKRIKWMRALIASFVGMLILVFLLILIDSFISNVRDCKELTYLITNSVGILACLVMFIAYRYNEIKQKIRIQKFNKLLASSQFDTKSPITQSLLKIKTPSQVNFNTPFSKMWFLIISNLSCRIIGLGQSLAFEFDWSQVEGICKISTNQKINYGVGLTFVFFTMYSGFMATIYVVRQKRKTKDQFQARIKSPSNFSDLSNFSNVDSGKNLLQMVAKQNFSIAYSDSNAVSNISDLYQRFYYQKQRKSQQYNQQ